MGASGELWGVGGHALQLESTLWLLSGPLCQATLGQHEVPSLPSPPLPGQKPRPRSAHFRNSLPRGTAACSACLALGVSRAASHDGSQGRVDMGVAAGHLRHQVKQRSRAVRGSRGEVQDILRDCVLDEPAQERPSAPGASPSAPPTGCCRDQLPPPGSHCPFSLQRPL